MKNNFLLKTVFFLELTIVALIAAGILPREFSYFITALVLIYFLGAEIIDSLILTILSIPLFLALPISDSYDSMSNWRIILAALFLVWTVRTNFLQNLRQTIKFPEIKNFFSRSSLGLWLTIFVLAAILSLFGSANAAAGLKKILFLGNIFLLFIIVRNIAKNKESFLKILNAGVFAAILTLTIGYAQLISVFFYSLYQFWQFWAENAIYALYGAKLAQLLSYSNTWFSYYSGDIPPTLRMFSVFPDSHSFALFNIILIPSALTLAWHYKANGQKYNSAACGFLIALMLLAILFSGSRGAWISAVTPLIIILFLTRRRNSTRLVIATDGDLTQILKTKYQKYKLKIKKLINYLLSGKLGVITASIALFFALFPVSSVILEQSQKAEWRRINSGAEMESSIIFKRFKSIADFEEISNKGRIEIWKDALKSIKNHPLLGVGIGNFPVVLGQNVSAAKKGASAHNLFLDIAAETGILGLIAFLGVFYEIGKTALRIFRNSKTELFKFFALAFGVYLFWILGYSLFDVVLFNDKVLMMFMIVVGLLYAIQNLIPNQKT